MKRRPLSLFCLAVILLLFVGAKLTGTLPSGFLAFEGETVTMTGRVYKKEISEREGVQRKILYLHPVPDAGTLQQAEAVICYLKENQSLPEIGSIVQVKGKLKCFEAPSNPGQFDAESYYRILKISFQLNQTEIQAKTEEYNKAGEMLCEIREFFSHILESRLSRQDASVMKAMLLGEKKAIDGEIKRLYQRNGIAHVLAISGLHVSLLGMTLYRFLRKAGAPAGLSAAFPAVLMVLYGFMTGFSVSALRAVLMFALHMAALFLGRTYDMVTAAFIAAVFLLLGQPLYLFDSGFLFSFGCIFAIAFLVPALTQERKEKGKPAAPDRWYTLALKALCQGGAITLAGLPLQLYFFYQTPVYGAVLNLLVIPLMSILLPGGILLLASGSLEAGISGMGEESIPFLAFSGGLCEKICSGAALLAGGILSLYERACTFCGKLPFSGITAGRPGYGALLLYGAALLGVICCRKKLSLKKRWLIMLCGAVLLILPKGGGLEVTFLDVGQGDCIHIKSSAGHHYLVDGGSSSVSKSGTYRIAPYLKYQGTEELEAVFLTHPDSDHCSGVLELLKEEEETGIRIKKLYLPEIGKGAVNESYKELVRAADDAGVRVGYVSRGDVFREGEMELLCLHPEKDYENPEPNQYSTVLLLKYGNFSTLLTGDVEGEGERELEESLKRTKTENITVLKAAHHGSANSTSQEILALLDPDYTVISCGKNNGYGHPHRELTERLLKQGTEIFITYESGAVTFRTDGKRLQIQEFLAEN